MLLYFSLKISFKEFSICIFCSLDNFKFSSDQFLMLFNVFSKFKLFELLFINSLYKFVSLISFNQSLKKSTHKIIPGGTFKLIDVILINE